MDLELGKNIRSLRCKRQVNQEDLAAAIGVTVQAVSKWETGRANPDIALLPKLAEYFGITIDQLFFVKEEENRLSEEAAQLLEQNSNWWAGISEADMTTTALPHYGFFTPTEETLCLLGDVRGKTVLEIACGDGHSLSWLGEKGAKELWGLDISAAQIKRAKCLLKETRKKANLFVSPMEVNPGLPHSYFDLVFSIYGLGWTMDLDKTILHITEYLKPGGRLLFAWDNPLMQCISSQNGQYVFSKSYVTEQDILFSNHGETFCLHNWKLSTYLNCLANHGFLIEQVVEESSYEEKEAEIFREGNFYSADRAKLFNPSIIVKAKKL